MSHRVDGESRQDELKKLFEDALAGDEKAIGQLLEQYRPFLLQIANEELDPRLKSKLGGSDVVQESLLEASQSFSRFQGNSLGSVEVWMRRILLNNLANVHRHFHTDKRNVNREVQCSAFDSKSGSITAFATAIGSTSDACRKHEEFQWMEEALKRLSEDHQRVIELRNQQKKSFQEIGDELGRSADAARKLWARAIESLQQVWKGLENEGNL